MGFLAVVGVWVEVCDGVLTEGGQLSDPTDGGGPSIESSVNSSPAAILANKGEDSC